MAEVAGLQPIQEWNNKQQAVERVISVEEERKLLSSSSLTERDVLNNMGCTEAQPWPAGIKWRSFDGAFLQSIGAKIIHDTYADNVAALFLVKISGRVRGGVKAVYEKKQGGLGYLTMRGEWVSSYGLFPYDYTKRLIQKHRFSFVILVEGPRDALRLLRLGIPAIAVLGANTIGKRKALFISSLGVDTVYVMPDNDKGGKALWENLKQRLTERGLVPKRLKLPREVDQNNKLIKMDPFNAPREVIKNLTTLLKERHSWHRN